MIDIFILINRINNEAELVNIYNHVAKRLNILRAKKILPKAEIKNEGVEIVDAR